MSSSITDQLGREIDISEAPLRIICTVPSLTEFLYDLGLAAQIIGVTKFCDHPKSLTKKVQKIGGTKNVNLEKVEELKPDLIITNKEENQKDQILALAENHKVLVTNIKDLASSFEGLRLISRATHKEKKGDEIVSIIKEQQELFDFDQFEKLKVAYLIWKGPYMTIGHDTFIHDILDKTGFINVFENRERYPQISIAQIKSCDPDLIMLSSEPFPFKEKHAKEIEQELDCPIILVNGEYFSWYGSRMIFAFKYINDLRIDLENHYDK